MIPEDKLWPVSEYWDYHCTTSGSAMNSMSELTRTINGIYGEADSFEDYVRKGHAADYDATRAMFEAFRANIPVSTGIVQWMLNSAWPAIYWQQYDWYGVPVAAYYATKKACEPIQLIYNYKDHNVYAVNEGTEKKEIIASVKVYNVKSDLIFEEVRVLESSYRNTVKAFDLNKFQGSGHFIALEITDLDGTFVTDNFYCIGAKPNEYRWNDDTWYYTPISKYTDLSFAFGQIPADVQIVTEKIDGGYAVTIVNNSPVVAYMNVLKAKDQNGQLVVPAFWSDNFITLLPDQVKTVTCMTDRTDVNFEIER
jgi:exo-1,4-beta-D-glucosaminidase